MRFGDHTQPPRYQYLLYDPTAMALSIRLSYEQSKPLTPGSMVLGVVKFVGNQDHYIEALSFEFRGQTDAVLNENFGDLAVSRNDYASRTYLFSRHLDIYTGECIHRKGTYAWPFAFRIPLFAAPRILPRGSKEQFHQISPWKGDATRDTTMEPHPLPPSMMQGGRFICAVQYVLEAKLLCRTLSEGVSKPKTKECKASKAISVENLNMPSLSPPEYVWPYMISRHVMRCRLPPPGHPRPVVGRLLKILSLQSQKQSSDPELRLSVLLSKKLEIEQESTLSVILSAILNVPTADMNSSPPQTARFPDLVMSRFKISLMQHTAVRAGCHSSLSVKHIFTRNGSCQVPVLRACSSTPETSRRLPASHINLSDVVDLTIPTNVLAADFSTYNIARFHRLNVSLSMVYMGKKHKIRLREVPIRIAPRSGAELERRLSEGLEIDDEYGCELAGIKWRRYRQRGG